MSEDRIYSMPLDRVGDFAFDEMVVDVFPDMISRSVPGYASVLAMTAELAERYAVAGSNVYDLGCSLGAATFLIRERVPKSCRIWAIDSSAAMVTKLRNLLADPSAELAKIETVEADIRDIDIQDATFAILNFTLQFVPTEQRAVQLRTICEGLRDGGALVLSEKVHFADPEKQALMTELHHDFKRANGYSELEIAQKRTALENTLVTDTIETHLERLESVGFRRVSLWFQCFNFVSILAVK